MHHLCQELPRVLSLQSHPENGEIVHVRQYNYSTGTIAYSEVDDSQRVLQLGLDVLTLSPLGPEIPAEPLSPGIPCRPGGPWAPAAPAGPIAPYNTVIQHEEKLLTRTNRLIE